MYVEESDSYPEFARSHNWTLLRRPFYEFLPPREKKKKHSTIQLGNYREETGKNRVKLRNNHSSNHRSDGSRSAGKEK